MSDDEIRAALFASGLHKVDRTVVTRWKDGIDLDFPIPEVVAFARAVEREAYERAAQECESRATAPQGEDYLACYYACATAIRALGREK